MFLHEMASVSLDYVKEDMVNYICGNNYQNRNNYQFYIELNNDFNKKQIEKLIHTFIDNFKNKSFGSLRGYYTFYYKDLCFKTEYYLINYLIRYRTAKRRVEKFLKKYSQYMITKIYAPGGSLYNKLFEVNKKHFKEGQ
jgi:hypothetical protein